MLNGIRRRDSHDEGFEDGSGYSPGQQRVRVSSGSGQSHHYDIYALPSSIPPSPLCPSSSHFQSCHLFVVNRAAGLSGLGIRIGLASDPATPTVLAPTTDPGFSLLREQGYDASKAIQLGWVGEERVAELERFVKACPVPVVRSPSSGREAMDWILEVGRKLEWEGILANADLLLSDILDRR
ncbi:hypothetical protein JCM10212_001331 [Sporobolomyces blumeae]